MARKLIVLMVAATMVVSLIGLALAESPGGNQRKGKYLFRKHCRSCHVEGGAAADMSPSDKPQAQWNELYAKWQEIKCSGDWKELSDEDRKDIFTYMHDFAQDSPTPAKCS